MDDKYLKLLILSGIVLINLSLVLSLSVYSPYYSNNPLKVSPGMEREIVFDIHNCPSKAASCDQEDITADVSIVEGSNIAGLVSGTKYNLDFGESSKVRLKVSIPANAAIGDSYNVRMLVQSVPKGSGVQVGVQYSVEFPVIITDASQVPQDYVSNQGTTESNLGMFLAVVILLVVIILVIVIILYRMLRKKKQI